MHCLQNMTWPLTSFLRSKALNKFPQFHSKLGRIKEIVQGLFTLNNHKSEINIFTTRQQSLPVSLPTRGLLHNHNSLVEVYMGTPSTYRIISSHPSGTISFPRRIELDLFTLTLPQRDSTKKCPNLINM